MKGLNSAIEKASLSFEDGAVAMQLLAASAESFSNLGAIGNVRGRVTYSPNMYNPLGQGAISQQKRIKARAKKKKLKRMRR